MFAFPAIIITGTAIFPEEKHLIKDIILITTYLLFLLLIWMHLITNIRVVTTGR